VLAAANAAHQPLVVELGASWCAACKYFETKVLPDPRVQAALEGVTFVHHDVDTQVGEDAAHQLGVNALPTVAGIDRQGRIRVLKKGTEASPEHFLEFLREVHMVLDHQR
jgi:thiol:disulfide interchange protein